MSEEKIREGALLCIAKYGADADKPSVRLALDLITLLDQNTALRGALEESIDMTREATNPLVAIGEGRRLHMRERLAYLRTVLEASRAIGAKP